MVYKPKIHHRRSIRLKGYDYSQTGLYFVTICCQNKECLFGNIVWEDSCERFNDEFNILRHSRSEMILNSAGIMIQNEWLALPRRFTNIQLHEFVIMPNHFHAIIEIVGTLFLDAQGNNVMQKNIESFEVGQAQKGTPIVGDIIGAFKSITIVKYINAVKTNYWKPFNQKLWQRNYWEHIIRSEKSFEALSEYIRNNPKNWGVDKLNT